MKGDGSVYKTTFESLDCVNEAIGALELRQLEIAAIVQKMGENYKYPAEKQRLINKINYINSAIASLYDSEVYLPHLEPARRVEEDAIPIKIEGWDGN